MVLSKDLSHLLSEESKSRRDSPLKAAIKYRNLPGMRSLGGGLPIPELFPFDNLHVESPAAPFPDGVKLADFKDTKLEDVHIARANKDSDQDVELATSLQYGSSLGEPRLREFIKEHTRRVHKIGFEDWDVLIGVGNTFTWDAMLRTFTNRGDSILVEEFAFTSALETAHANGTTAVGVKMDLDGIIPEALEAQLANWVGPLPKLLYTVPTGQNPTGSSLSAERREKVYQIASKYDFLIIEDEPYYYLQFPQYVHPESSNEHHESGVASSNAELIKSFVPSFLQFDTEGRVLRLDSFSKVIAPGTRLSWVVAQDRFIERLLRLSETTMQNAAGFSTSIVYGILRRWGQEGYLQWLNKLKNVYSQARDLACDTIIENFPKGKFEFEPPVAGMFYWFKIDARRFRGFAENGRDPVKCEMKLFELGLERKVMIVPGHWFVTTSNTNPPQPSLAQSEAEKYAMYFRGTFAGVDDATLKSALADFGKLLHEELLDEIKE